MYDRPFLWGSKRTGPDLHRVGGKYNDNWHFNHFWDPQTVSEGSIMPRYTWLIRNKLDRSQTEDKMKTLVSLGVPYTEDEIANAQESMANQAMQIEQNLLNDPDFARTYNAEKASAQQSGEDFIEMRDREVVAMIAYLQRLGTDIKVKSNDDEELTSQ